MLVLRRWLQFFIRRWTENSRQVRRYNQRQRLKRAKRASIIRGQLPFDS